MKDKEKIEEKCDCKHTLHFVLTLGDGCAHIVPHPTKKQIKGEIKPWLKQMLEDL